MCRKWTYSSPAQAQMALDLIRDPARPDALDRKEVAFYRCPDCEKWHLTKQVQTRKKEN